MEANTVMVDIVAEHAEMMARIQDKYPQLEMAMIPDETHGTLWKLTSRNWEKIICLGAVWVNIVSWDRDGSCYVRPRCSLPTPVLLHSSVPIDKIEKWIRSRHPEINDWSLDDDLVVYGLVQCGKTELILSMIWISQYVYKIPCVMVLANMTGSYNQVLGKNCFEFNQMLRQEFGEGVQPFFLHSFGYRGCNDRLNINDHTQLHVAMGNPSQLKRLVNTINGRFLLFCDEADTHVKGWNDEADKSSTGPLIRKLQEKAVGSIKITATPFSLWNQDGVRQKTLVMRTPSNYRGLDQTEWVYSTNKDAEEVRDGNPTITVRLLDKMITVVRPRVENKKRRYLSILVNGPSQIETQNYLAYTIAQRRHQWNVYVMNSKGGIQRATLTGNIPTGLPTISTLYDRFEEESNDTFQINIIIACLTAARAISFRPTTKQKGTGGLHGMLFFPSHTSHTAQLIQFMRVWGKYEDEYPLIRVMTTQKTHERLQLEIDHNFKVFAQATLETGVSRVQIEGTHIMDVGLHDRRVVDDTHITDKMSLLQHEFETQEEVREFLANDFGNKMTIMTERLVSVMRSDVEGGFQYGEHIGNTMEGRRMKRKLEEHVAEIVPKDQFQIGWHSKRYEDLHNMKRRYGDSSNYMSRMVAGSGDDQDEFVHIVVWKPEFSNRTNVMENWSLERFRPDRAYLFQTTKNTWRYYTTNEKRKMGLLAH